MPWKKCPSSMSRQNVPVKCPCKIYQQYVPAKCPGKMSKQNVLENVPTKCPSSFSRKNGLVEYREKYAGRRSSKKSQQKPLAKTPVANNLFPRNFLLMLFVLIVPPTTHHKGHFPC